MTQNKAEGLKAEYEPILIGKPISRKTPDILIEEIEIKEIFPNNYEVVLVTRIEEGEDRIYRTLKDYLEEENQS